MKIKRKTISLSAIQAKEVMEGSCTCLRLPVKLKCDNTHFEMKTDKYGTRLIEIENDVEGVTFGKHPDGRTWRRLRAFIEVEPPYRKNEIVQVLEPWRVGAWDEGNQMLAADFKDGSFGDLVPVSDEERFHRIVEKARCQAHNAGCAFVNGEPVWDKGNSPCSWNAPRSMPRELSRVSIVVESCEAVQVPGDNGAENGQESWVWEVTFRTLE